MDLDKNSNCPQTLQAHKYLAKAMRLRWEDPQVMKPTCATTPREVYGHHTEAVTLEDVEALRPDPEAHPLAVLTTPLTWEALVIRERILGIASEDLALSIWLTASRMGETRGGPSRDYQKISALFVHAIKVRSLTKGRLDDFLLLYANFLASILLDKQSKALETDVRCQDYLYALTTAADVLRDMNLYVRGKSNLINSKVCTGYCCRLFLLDILKKILKPKKLKFEKKSSPIFEK